MKLTLLLAGAVLALGSGCATYTGGTGDASGSDASLAGTQRMVVPVWKQPSPSGHEMGGNRPELEFYRY